MNSSKKIIFAFFISAALMNNKFSSNNVQAAEIMPNTQSSAYTSSSNVFTKYGYKGQCTWFTYGRVLEKLQLLLPSEFYGNAVDWWFANARDKVYPYGTEPKPNSIAVWSGGNYGYGHVAFVENVDGNTVYFNEGNFSVRGAYDGKLKSISKEEIKKRGNLYLKGYIYIGEGKINPTNNINNSGQSSNNTEPVINKGTVNISNSGSVLNVRDNSNASSNVIGLLRKGEAVNIVGKSGDWYKIKYNSSYGYVNCKYIDIVGQVVTSKPSITILSSNSSNTSKSGVVYLSDKSSSLNLRTAPNGSVITVLNHGTKIDILSSDGGWYKVSSNGNIGYVHSNYVSLSTFTSTNLQNSTSSESKIGTVVLSAQSSSLNLRNNPWTGRIISALPSGAKVEVLENNGRWYKVKAGSEIGYVHSDYIKL